MIYIQVTLKIGKERHERTVLLTPKQGKFISFLYMYYETVLIGMIKIYFSYLDQRNHDLYDKHTDWINEIV